MFVRRAGLPRGLRRGAGHREGVRATIQLRADVVARAASDDRARATTAPRLPRPSAASTLPDARRGGVVLTGGARAGRRSWTASGGTRAPGLDVPAVPGRPRRAGECGARRVRRRGRREPSTRRRADAWPLGYLVLALAVGVVAAARVHCCVISQLHEVRRRWREVVSFGITARERRLGAARYDSPMRC